MTVGFCVGYIAPVTKPPTKAGKESVDSQYKLPTCYNPHVVRVFKEVCRGCWEGIYGPESMRGVLQFLTLVWKGFGWCTLSAALIWQLCPWLPKPGPGCPSFQWGRQV